MAKGPNIWRDVTAYVRNRAPREVHNDDIANGLHLTREQVRACMTKRIKDHPEEGFVESRPWVYAHMPTASPLEQAFADDRHVNPGKYAPVSAQPVTVSDYGRTVAQAVAMMDDHTPTFRYLAALSEGEVLVQDDANDVWRARRLS